MINLTSAALSGGQVYAQGSIENNLSNFIGLSVVWLLVFGLPMAVAIGVYFWVARSFLRSKSILHKFIFGVLLLGSTGWLLWVSAPWIYKQVSPGPAAIQEAIDDSDVPVYVPSYLPEGYKAHPNSRAIGDAKLLYWYDATNQGLEVITTSDYDYPRLDKSEKQCVNGTAEKLVDDKCTPDFTVNDLLVFVQEKDSSIYRIMNSEKDLKVVIRSGLARDEIKKIIEGLEAKD